MRLIDIPVVGIGPGSQPAEEDGAELAYLSMPTEMQTYRPALLPEKDELDGMDEALAALRRLKSVLGGFTAHAPPEVIDLAGLSDAERSVVGQMLGEGEVSARIEDSETSAEIQETRLAGVWRVRALGPHGGLQRDTLEVGDIPALLRNFAFANAFDEVVLDREIPDGVLNAPPVLVELADRASNWRPGEPAHVVNLTLLPQTEEDLAFLQECLGTGGTTLLSRGYGNCRITATRVHPVWWVQYFNSEDALILNTLEVTDVPVAALAALEDIRDSADRLAEMLETLT